jgi:hypothetical protein
MPKIIIILLAFLLLSCESYGEHHFIMKITGSIVSSICKETEFLINLAVLIVFLSAIVAGIVLGENKKQIMYFWLPCQFAFFLVLANVVLFPRFECLYYNKYAPTEIFKIGEGSGLYETEYFVISNPPNDTLLLKKIVEEYNFQTISADKLKKYKDYERKFYRETECLTRNYEEGKPYPRPQGWLKNLLFIDCPIGYLKENQNIRYHSKDLLMTTTVKRL